MDILIFLPFFSIIGFSTYIANRSNIYFIYTAPAVLSAILLSLYVADILGIIFYIAPLIMLIGIFLFIFSLIQYPGLVNKINDYKKEIILVAIILLSVFLFYSNYLLTYWDDLAFWGMFSKQLFNSNVTFSDQAQSLILKTHYHYPRGPSYFHYFTMYFSGMSDSGLLTSHFMMHLLLATPFFAGRYFIQGIIFLILFYLIPLKESLALVSIYNDSTIGFVTTSCLGIMLLCPDKKKAALLLMPTFFMFPIYREIGWLIGVCTGIIISVILFLQEIENFDKYKKILVSLLLISLPIISKYLWFLYVDMFGVLGRDTHKLSTIIELFNALLAGHETYWSVVGVFAERVVRALKSETFVFIYVLIALTTIAIISYQRQYLKQYLLLLFVTTVCFLLFLAFRLYLYIPIHDMGYGCVKDGKLLNIKCLVRYSSSYLIIYTAISAVYLSKILNESNVRKVLFTVLAIMLVTIFAYLFHKKARKLFQHDQHSLIVWNQINLFNQLANSGHDISYEYSYNGLDTDKKTLKCSSMSYYLYPNFLYRDIADCSASQENPDKDFATIRDKTISNIDTEELVNNNDRYKCDLSFNVLMNYLNIQCRPK